MKENSIIPFGSDNNHNVACTHISNGFIPCSHSGGGIINAGECGGENKCPIKFRCTN
jgi:hypothetical protein